MKIGVGTGLFDDVGESGDSRTPTAPNTYCLSENIARKAHAYILATDPSARYVYAAKLTKMQRAPSNNGVTVRKDSRDKRLTRAEILDNAMNGYPYLTRKIDGRARLGKKTREYRFRPIDVSMYEALLASICRETSLGPVDVFGRWGLWPDTWTSEAQASIAAP